MQNAELKNPMAQKPRYEFIDLAKGICIILVVMDHIGFTTRNNAIGLMLNSFRMPLYFILSGIFFSQYSGFFDFVIKKTNKLVIPFICFVFISWFLLFLMNILFPIKFQGIDIIIFLANLLQGKMMTNGPLWFLLSLFFCGIIFYLIILISNKFKYELSVMIVLSFLIGSIGFLLGLNEINVPLWVDSAMTATPFYAFGYILRKKTNFLQIKLSKVYCLGLSMCLLIITYFIATPSSIYSNSFECTSFPLYYLSGMIGTMSILFLCKSLNRVKGISYYGRYSICVLVTHVPILVYFTNPISFKIFGDIFGYVVISWISLFILFILYLWVIPFMLKFMPYICAQKDLIKLKH